MLSILCVRLTIKVKVGIPESFKVGWYPPKKTGSSHLKDMGMKGYILHLHQPSVGEICPWVDSYHQNKTATIISHG